MREGKTRKKNSTDKFIRPNTQRQDNKIHTKASKDKFKTRQHKYNTTRVEQKKV
jgi:hypothetical protein